MVRKPKLVARNWTEAIWAAASVKVTFHSRSVYVPGGREGKEYPPESLVVTVRAAFVPTLRAGTVASLIMAPVESRISPDIAPNVWQKAAWCANREHPRTNSRAIIRIISIVVVA